MVSSRSCSFSINVLKCSTFFGTSGRYQQTWTRASNETKLRHIFRREQTTCKDRHTISIRDVHVVLFIRPLPAKVKMLTLSLLSVVKSLSLLSSVFHCKAIVMRRTLT